MLPDATAARIFPISTLFFAAIAKKHPQSTLQLQSQLEEELDKKH